MEVYLPLIQLSENAFSDVNSTFACWITIFSSSDCLFLEISTFCVLIGLVTVNPILCEVVLVKLIFSDLLFDISTFWRPWLKGSSLLYVGFETVLGLFESNAFVEPLFAVTGTLITGVSILKKKII